MAKKSAKSKGFRKTTGKKPYLSKRDIIILCVVVAALIVGAILLFSYDDGALKTRGGEIVDKGENWLIVNGARNSGGRRYFKVGEAGELEGWRMETSPILSDANLTQFTYYPEDEESGIASVSLYASPAGAERLAQNTAAMYASVENCEVTEIAEAEAAGHSYRWYSYTHGYYVEETEEAVTDEAETEEAAVEAEAEETTTEEAPAEEAEAAADEAQPEDAEAEAPAFNHFEQALNAYMDSPVTGCIVVSVSVDPQSEDDYLTEDQLKAAAEAVFAQVQLEENAKAK